MALWFDLLRRPMAAPESRCLRRLRIAWQMLCLLTALCVGFINPLHGLLGKTATCLAAGLIAMTVTQTMIYWVAKQRSDNPDRDLREHVE